MSGRNYTVKKTDTSANEVRVVSTNGVDGITTYLLTAKYEFITVASDGAVWTIIASN